MAATERANAASSASPSSARQATGDASRPCRTAAAENALAPRTSIVASHSARDGSCGGDGARYGANASANASSMRGPPGRTIARAGSDRNADHAAPARYCGCAPSRMTRTRRCLAAVLALLPVAAATAQKNDPKDDGYQKALLRYRECMQRVAFVHHTEGRNTLARTGTPEALKVLAADYLGAKDYAEYSRYTLATMFRRSFDDAAAVEPFARLRE